jgi:DNA repair protein RadA/Sms
VRGRARTVFTCPECEAWSSFAEELEAVEPRSSGASGARGAVAPAGARAVPLADLSAETLERIPTGVGELDRCLGGGLVPGSLALLGGEPGIGKSTLLLQVSERLASQGRQALYVSGEESPAQVRLRSHRLGLSGRRVSFLGERDLDLIVAEAERLRPDLLVVDSVQVVKDPSLASSPGTVSQVRQAAERFLRLSKTSGTATILVGHVTKEGSLAGPRTLEHVVDTVLSFEAEGSQVHRLVRTMKNRFGPTGEVGVFEMRGDGLIEVPDASRLFLAERRAEAPGSVVFPTMEGTRPVLVEVQALVGDTAYAQPKRMTLGVDAGRLALLLAVLCREAAVQLGPPGA